MRKCIAIVFLITFLFQFLPMKMLSKAIAKAKTEETSKDDCGDDDANSDDCDDCDDSVEKSGKYNDYIITSEQSHGSAVNRKMSACATSVYKAEVITCYTPEVLSPPPNC